MPGPAIPSPSLALDPAIRAFELKFLLADAVAAEVQRWAEGRLALDPHGDPALAGQYRTTTLYLDTTALDVARRSPGFTRRKYRIRRYGDEPRLWLERKVRNGDRVRKRREAIDASELERAVDAASDASAPAGWFRDEIHARALRPAARIEYWRTAWVGMGSDGPLRLTLDRAVRGAAAPPSFVVPAPGGGTELFAGVVICELKFRSALPPLFRQLVGDFALSPQGVSKYRRCMGEAP
jgi:hypothetical protein